VPDENMEATEPASADTPAVSSEVGTEPASDYTVKIDGQEQQVTLTELQDGYQRQADYTRKTQELAEERQRLQQAEAIASALETDPSGTIAALSSAFGVTDTLPATEPDYSDGVEEDPTTKRLAHLEVQMERQAQAQRQQALEREVYNLKKKYGDFDAAELFRHALTNRIPNLDAAFTHMKYGEVADTAEKLQKDQEITDAKRDATKVASGGGTQAGAVVSESGSDGKPSSLREAFALAKKQHGT
jgi:hypothetical protein